MKVPLIGRIEDLLKRAATQLNNLSEGRLAASYNALPAPPTTGSYAVGDFIRNSAVDDADPVFGWVYTDAGNWAPVGSGGGGGGAGTVTSVDLTAPAAGIMVSGGPVTTAGAITLALADDLAAIEGLAATGLVRRTGVSTWSAGTAVNLASEVTGTLPVANGGTGTATPSLVAGSGVTVTGTWPNQTVAASGGGGGVTSVGLSMPAEFSVAGTPVTTSGTLAVTKATQTANRVYAGPVSGSAAAPTFRALVPADLQGVTALVDGATISIDASVSPSFRVTLGGDRTLANPTNPVSGAAFKLRITQDATGSRLLSFGSAYRFVGAAPVLSRIPSVTDLLTCQYDATDSTWVCRLDKAYTGNVITPDYTSLIWSTQRRIFGYSGPAIRIRRSFDNTEQDINFGLDGRLDDAAIVAFAPTGQAYIAKWYEQHGTGFDFVQATTTKQPLIANGGATYKSGSYACPLFDNSDDFLLVANNSNLDFGTGDYAIETLAECTSVNAQNRLFDTRPGGAGNLSIFYFVTGNFNYFVTAANRITSSSQLVANQLRNWAVTRGSGTARAFRDGTQMGSNYTDSQNMNGAVLAIGNDNGGTGNAWQGYVHEVRVTKGSAVKTANYAAWGLSS